METTASPHPRIARPPFAAAVIALLAGVCGVASAADFDERIKAPQARNAETARLTARAVSQEFGDLSLDSRADVIRDASKSRRRFDARWALVHAIETRTPVGDLSELGLVPGANGQVSIRLKQFPQWDEVEGGMARLLSSAQLDGLGEQWISRGMTDDDVAAIRRYVSTHDCAAMARQAALPVSLSFSRAVRKYDKIKRPVPKGIVVDYFYQRDLATAEAYRAWVAGLLDALEPHAARILLSYFGELDSVAVWAPSDFDAAAAETLALMRRPDFDKMAEAEAQGGAK